MRLKVLGKTQKGYILLFRSACVFLCLHCPAVIYLAVSVIIDTSILMLSPCPIPGQQELVFLSLQPVF